jgi:hypothetical protein
LHANATGQKRWCQRESLIIWNFKTFYLSNDNSDLRSVFTNKSVTTRSSKLAPMLICFEKLFFTDLNLLTHLHVNYQPLCTWVINGKYKKLSTLKIKNIEIFILSKFTIYYLRKVLHANTTGQKRWCQREFLLIWNFKMFYLLNDNSDLKSVFTNKSISTRSLKLAPMLVCFDKLFFRT